LYTEGTIHVKCKTEQTTHSAHIEKLLWLLCKHHRVVICAQTRGNYI